MAYIGQPRFLWVLSAAMFLGASIAATHAAPAPLSADYAIRIWQTEEGLPQNTVTSITQTRDGYIWIGTYGGVARFDGERFQVFNAVNTPEMEDGRIVSLYEDRGGTLWIGHDSGAVTRCARGHFETVHLASKVGHERVSSIAEDSSGHTWLFRQNGAVDSARDGRVLVPLGTATPTSVLGSARSPDGRLWITRDGAVAELTSPNPGPIDFGPAKRTGYVMGIGASADGGLWIVRDWRIRKWKDNAWTEDRGECPWGETSVTTVLELRDGTLAVGTMDHGFYLVFADQRVVHFDRTNGLPQNWVRSVFEDREGNLWVAAGTGGLAAVRLTPFTVVNAPDQWQGRTVLSVAPGHDGSLWIGTEGAGVYRYREGTWEHFGEPEGLGNLFIWSVSEGPDQNVWVGTWGGGIYCHDSGKFTRPPGTDTNNLAVLALHSAPDDTALWLGTSSGLLRWQNGVVRKLFPENDTEVAIVSTMVRDAKGALWFGLSGGLGRLAEGKITRFTKKDGLSSDSVQCLLADLDGALWIGTADGGLNRLKDGNFSVIGVNEGLASNVICHIADDGLGHLWLSTHHGIIRLAKSEVNRCADHVISTVFGQSYDRSDGLPTIEYSGGLQAAGCKTTDGRLWFSSSKGLVTVQPASIRLNPTPPPLAFESLRVDGRPVDVANVAAPPRIGPDHQRLEFQYTGLSFVAPNKVLFRYRLDGLDKDWVEASPRRSASYSHLPAGDYRFQVIACNNDGVWNVQPVTVAFTVLPFFWQTWWFRGLVALAILSVVAAAVRSQTRRRMQRRVEQLEREHAIERERARIAQDIHDDIGASLTRITMLSQSVRTQFDTPDQAASVLDGIYGTAREVTRALDEIVWAIDPTHDTLDSLVGYMGKFAQDFLGAANVRCRLDLPVELPAWPLTAEIRHNLFLAFKEALNNAVKHAAATEVRVSLSLRDDAFVLSVKDNGGGLPVAETATKSPDRPGGGHGLPNLQRRLALIGGRCEIESRPGEGTLISFIVTITRPRAST